MRTELRRTMPAAWAHVSAMHVLLDVRDLHAVGEYLTIHDLTPSHGRPVVCNINGEYIGRADWWQPVRCGDVVVFTEVAAGGNAGRLLGMIVVAAAAAITGGLVGAAYGAAWGTAAAAGVSFAGSMLVNALFPAVTTPLAASSTESSPTYNVALRGNRPRIDQADLPRPRHLAPVSLALVGPGPGHADDLDVLPRGQRADGFASPVPVLEQPRVPAGQAIAGQQVRVEQPAGCLDP